MCTCTQPIPTTTANGFDEKLMNMITNGTVAMMISIGHRTGLFDAMSGMRPASSREIADQTGLNERYVREWLGAMTAAAIVINHPEDSTFVLPPEHASFLTRAASPSNLAALAQWISVLGSVEDLVVDAFKHGKGVPYSAYKRFHPVMAEESGQTIVAALMDHILPLAPGLMEQLERGIDVLDIGCGSGQAMNALAATFPMSRFTGYDISEEGIAAARKEAEKRGSTNIRFEVVDVAVIPDAAAYDLITAFDAVHDQARPDLVLANVHKALRPGGTFLMQDIAASSHVHQNLDNPMAAFIYTISCMHCMSVSLANNGMGLGAAWGKEKALEMLGEAGFDGVRVEQLEHDPMNYYYVMNKR